MGGAEPSSIQYVFRSSWLFSVLVRAQNKENFESLKKDLFRKYGPVNPPDKKNEVYLWKGNVTSIKLTYRAPSEEVILEIGSTKSVKDFAKDVEEGGLKIDY